MDYDQTFQLRFQCESHSINADTMVKVLTEYIKILKEINKTQGYGSLEIQINAFERGSFKIDFSPLRKVFNSRNFEIAADIANISLFLFTVFGSQQPQITYNIKNDITINQNTINNPIIDRSIKNIYGAIISDKEIEGINFIQDGDTVYISKNQMKEAITLSKRQQKVHESQRNDTLYMKEAPSSIHTEIEKKTNIHLKIIDYSQSNSKMWEVEYNNFPIIAEVSNLVSPKCIDLVRTKRNTIIVVTLEVEKIYINNTLQNIKYSIIDISGILEEI